MSTLNMGAAAYAASLADGVSTGVQKQEVHLEKIPLRRGKWTTEEEQFAMRLIEEFRSGLLPLTDGTTLRTFLSKLLNCDPMRISKKFVGEKCIGKQVFRHASGEMNGFLSAERMERSKRELAELERKFLDRLLSTSTTPTPSPRSSTNTTDPSTGERKPKKAKVSLQDSHMYIDLGSDEDGNAQSGMQNESIYGAVLHQSSHLHHSHQPQSFMQHPHSHDPHYYSHSMGSGMDGAPTGFPPSFAPPSGGPIHPGSMYSSHGSDLPSGGSMLHSQPQNYAHLHPGFPYPVSRGVSEGSGGGYEDWRQLQMRHGPFDAQLNWHNQYLPSQQFFDQHQNQLRSMGGVGGNGDQSEEGLLKAKGSFYKSIKSSSTSSLDLLGTLATSISRENLVSYGTNGDSSCALSSLGGGDPGVSGGMSRSELANNNMKRNSKSIQDFWMLVEMGDLSRPENEDLNDHNNHDVDAAVFDCEDDSKSNHAPPSMYNSGSGGGGGGGGSLLPCRSESAPALSSNTHNTLKTHPISGSGNGSGSGNAGTSFGSSTYNNIADRGTLGSSYGGIPSSGFNKGSDHDPVILQSLLSMASAEHMRMDNLHPPPDAPRLQGRDASPARSVGVDVKREGRDE